MRIDAITSGQLVRYPRLQPVPQPRSEIGRLRWPFASTGMTLKFRRNQEVFGEGEPRTFVYQVISGAIRSFTVLSDGRRLISAFHLPGDIFGIERADVHHASAEAMVDTKLLLVERSILSKAQACNLDVALQIWEITCAELERLQGQSLLRGRKDAAARCAAFLISMAQRQSERHIMSLSMSRLDIADYLGLTVETISRTMTRFERDGIVKLMRGRKIVFMDRGRLEALML